jgi:predicted aspartyl protease
VRFSYDRSQVPPAPRLEVTLGAPGEALSIGPLAALVDTGADLCIIPSHYLAPLNLVADDEGYLRPSGGARRRVQIFTVDLGIGRTRLPAVEVAADEVEVEPVLGRNVLNKLLLVLDGPHELLEIQES